VPGKIFLYYSILDKNQNLYDIIMNKLESTGDLINDATNNINEHTKLLLYDNNMVDENIKQYRYILSIFPGHISLLVPKSF
jgi:hypothetical protein